MTVLGPRFPREDRESLAWAVQVLEHPSFLAKLAGRIGHPLSWLIEQAERKIPGAGGVLDAAAHRALEAAASLAIATLGTSHDPLLAGRTIRAHRWATVATGALGGAFGLPALAFELPLTTTLILRSIATIARGEGEDLTTLDARLACLQVFALGGRSPADDTTDSAYFAIRIGLESATKRLATQAAADSTLATLIAKIIPRFEADVAEKLAAQAIPIIGAAGGAAVNLAFTAYFQTLAQAHFTIRRLDRTYGPKTVRSMYDSIRSHGLPAS